MTAEIAVGTVKAPARAPAKTWLGRVARFSAARFPLYPNVVVICAQFAVNYFVLARLLVPGAPRPFVPLDFVLGGALVALFVFLLRTFDEIKDYKADAINFPDRPLVSGVLDLKDIRLLWKVVVAVQCVLVLPFIGRPVLWAFLVTLVFSWLTFKWFFFEKQISASLPLALATHNPLVYLWQYFLLSLFLAPGEVPVLGAVLYMLGDGMTGTAWEIARKIRGTEQEDGYSTYSKCWGPKVPVVVVACIEAVAAALMIGALAQKVAPVRLALLWIPAACVWLVFVAQGVRFFRDTRQAPKFQPLAEAFKLCAILAVTAAFLFPGG